MRSWSLLRSRGNDSGVLREQVRVLVERQEKVNKRILLTSSQRMKDAAKAKRLSRKMRYPTCNSPLIFLSSEGINILKVEKQFLISTANRKYRLGCRLSVNGQYGVESYWTCNNPNR